MRISVRLRRLFRFVVALGVVPFLPIYARCTMVRSQVMGQPGDLVDYHWRASSLVVFIADYPGMSPEAHAAPLLLANLLFGVSLVLGIGLWHSSRRCPRS